MHVKYNAVRPIRADGLKYATSSDIISKKPDTPPKAINRLLPLEKTWRLINK